MLGYIFNPSTHKSEEGKSLVIPSTVWSKQRDSEQAGLYNETLPQRQKENELNELVFHETCLQSYNT